MKYAIDQLAFFKNQNCNFNRHYCLNHRESVKLIRVLLGLSERSCVWVLDLGLRRSRSARALIRISTATPTPT